MLLFDTRLGMDGTYPPYVGHDGAAPFVSMPLNENARYAVLSPVSAKATGTPWTALRFFRGHITQDTFRTMLNDINAFCAAPRDAAFCDPTQPSGDAFVQDSKQYDVQAFGFLHEVFRTPDSNISMGLHFYDLGIWRFGDVAPLTIN
jgi:hypothetical protein